MNILPQITQITQSNAAELYYFAEKDCLELMWFWGSSASSARSAGDLGVPWVID